MTALDACRDDASPFPSPTADRTADAPLPRDLLFGPFRLSACERRLEHAGAAVPLGGRALDLLLALALRAGDVVSKAELCEAVWPGLVVEDAALRFHIASLRRALRTRDGARDYITTVAGRGYCLSCEVRSAATTASFGRWSHHAASDDANEPALPSPVASIPSLLRLFGAEDVLPMQDRASALSSARHGGFTIIDVTGAIIPADIVEEFMTERTAGLSSRSEKRPQTRLRPHILLLYIDSEQTLPHASSANPAA